MGQGAQAFLTSLNVVYIFAYLTIYIPLSPKWNPKQLTRQAIHKQTEGQQTKQKQNRLFLDSLTDLIEIPSCKPGVGGGDKELR